MLAKNIKNITLYKKFTQIGLGQSATKTG